MDAQKAESERGTVVFLKENDQVPTGSPGVVQDGTLSTETIRWLRRECLMSDHLTDLLDRAGLKLSDASIFLQYGDLGCTGWKVFTGRQHGFKIFIGGTISGNYRPTHVELPPGPLDEMAEFTQTETAS